VDVMGVSIATNAVTVNGQTAYRKGEYCRQQLSVGNSSGAVWQSVTNASPGQTSVIGNQFVPQTPELFKYDLDGNLISDGRWNYGWDAENRLVALTNNTAIGPQQVIRFEYDAKGRRIHKQVWGNNVGSGSPTNDVKFVYDGWNLVALLNAPSSLLETFLWGLDLSGSLQSAGGVGGLLEVVYCGATTTNCFAAFDGNGNVAALVDASNGTSTAQYEYGPFGEVLRATGPMAKANPFRFSSKYQDDETDLLNYGYRYYNANTGRWLSRDKAAESGGHNLYAFVENKPASAVDGDGRFIAWFAAGLKEDCGGWVNTWVYQGINIEAPGSYVVQRITISESKTGCKQMGPPSSSVRVFYEALLVKSTSLITDQDWHPGHAGEWGSHSITAEAKVFRLKDVPDISQWGEVPEAPGLKATYPAPPWWDVGIEIDAGYRSTSREWSCCCHHFEGEINHFP